MSENKEDQSAHVTARGMLSVLIKDLTSTVSAAVFFIFIARFLPNVDDLGFLTGLQTLSMMFIVLSSLGLPNSATRFISAYIGAGNTDRAERLYPVIFLLCITSSIIFSLILYYLSPFLSLSLFHGQEYTELIEIASVDVFLSSMISTCIFLLYASKRFAKVSSYSIINSTIRFSLAFIFFLIGWGLYGIILGLIIGDIMGLSLFISALASKIRVRNASSLFLSLLELKPVFKFALPFYGSMILHFVSSRLDIYVLIVLSTLYAVGIYSPALFVANTFILVLVAMEQGMLPVTARIYGKSGVIRFKSISRFASRYLFLFYFPLGISIAASAPSLIALLMGERFIEATYPLAILIIGITLTSPVQIFNNLLRSAGYSGILLKNEAMSISVQILMSAIMIPPFGIVGAATAKLVSRFVYLIYPYIKVKRLGGLDYDAAALKNGLASSCFVGIVIIVLSTFILKPYYYLPLVYIITLLMYLLFLRVTHALNKDDVGFIDRTLMGKIKWLKPVLCKLVIG